MEPSYRVSKPRGPLPDCALPLTLPVPAPSEFPLSHLEPSLLEALAASAPSRAALLESKLSLLLLAAGPLPGSLSAEPLEPMEVFFRSTLDASEPPLLVRGVTRTASASFICSECHMPIRF